MNLFPSNMLAVAPPLDGKTPVFEEVGAVPGATYFRPPGSIARFGTDYYWQAGTLAAPSWIILSYGGFPPFIVSSYQERWRQRALQKSGIDPSLAMWIWWDPMTLPLFPAAIGGPRRGWDATGGIVISNAAQANALARFELALGQLAAASAIGAVNTVIAKTVRAGAAVKLWMGAGMKLNTGAGAATRMGLAARSGYDVSVADGNREFLFGIDGSVSTANFVAFGAAGASLDTGVALDVAAHSFEYWRDGAAGVVCLDRGTELACTARVSADAVPGLMVWDSAAVERNLTHYWFGCLVEAVTP